MAPLGSKSSKGTLSIKACKFYTLVVGIMNSGFAFTVVINGNGKLSDQ